MTKQESQIDSFYDFGLHPDVEDAVETMNYGKPSPVQAATIPLIMDGEDIIACAQTGTGKTAAYLLPVLSELAYGDYPKDHVNCVIMAPTRELAQQIDRQIDGFAYYVKVNAQPIYGGTDGIEYEQQRRALAKGADIVVATPGRLLSHIDMNSVDLSQVSFFILDEADRMLDMGFSEDILKIQSLLPKKGVQTVMFSATMPEQIRTFARKIMRRPKEVNIAISRPPESISQSAFVVSDDDKLSLLVSLLNEQRPERCIVFLAAKKRVKEAARMLRMQGHSVEQMHSDLSQEERNEVMHRFRNGHASVIVATDILSRGIDIDNIELIINFDVPSDPEDYVHRIGRTSRGDNLGGSAVTFVSPRDKDSFARIEKFLGYKLQRPDFPADFKPGKPRSSEDRGKGRSGRRGGSSRGRGGRRPGNRSKKKDQMKIDFAKEDLAKLQDFLSVPRRITLLGHVSPDGDAVGSTLGFASLLRTLGHSATVVYPTAYSESFAFLPGASEALIAKDKPEEALQAIREAEGLFCLDFNETKRVEQLTAPLEESEALKLLIDHHPYPSDFADLSFSYPDRSSTCLIVYELIRAMEWRDLLSTEAATAIYTGMMTDTGNFAYNSEDPEIYQVISELLELGVRKDAVYDAINRSFTIDKLRLTAHLMADKITFFPQFKTAIITLSMADKGKYNYQTGDVEGLVNDPLAAKDIEFSILIHEMPKYTKISMRSKGSFAVNEFATKFFNGGGHTNAAGAEVCDTLSNTYKLVETAVRVLHP